MVLTEEQMVEMITEEMQKSDVINIIKHDKDFEKKVKEIIADCISEMFRVLWQHNGIFKSLAR